MAQQLPCLESSPECLTELTTLAISNSSEIEAINQRLELTGDRIDYAEARQWTDYLTLDPMRLVQNLLGGGDVQRNQLAIAELEIGATDLLRRREEVAESLGREVIDRVLDYEELDRRLESLNGQLATHEQRVAVYEVKYRTGQGSTTTMLSYWQRTDDLQARIEEVEIDQGQTVRELEVLCRVEETGTGATADSGGDRSRNSLPAEVSN
ncbi:MAG: hypothetical protein AAF728_03605 [Cyanobacteria bacterium P01_D01_bin.128]